MKQFQAVQHFVEQVTAIVMRAHAVAKMNHDSRIIVDRVEQIGERGVHLTIDVLNRVTSEHADHLRVETRVRAVVEVPLLMADGVAFAKHREEKVQSRSALSATLNLPLGAHAARQAVKQDDILLLRAEGALTMRVIVGRELMRSVGIHAEQRMETELRLDLDGFFGRPAMEAEMTVVCTPSATWMPSMAAPAQLCGTSITATERPASLRDRQKVRVSAPSGVVSWRS